MQDLPLGFLLVDAARLYRLRIDRAFEHSAIGLTAGEARVLTYADMHPGLRQSALAVKMNVEPMTLVGFLDRLEALGLVEREADPRDRRAKIIRLTPAAAPFLVQIREVGAMARGEALAGFNDAERDAFRDFLLRVRANLAREARCKDEPARDEDAAGAAPAAPRSRAGGGAP